MFQFHPEPYYDTGEHWRWLRDTQSRQPLLRRPRRPYHQLSTAAMTIAMLSEGQGMDRCIWSWVLYLPSLTLSLPLLYPRPYTDKPSWEREWENNWRRLTSGLECNRINYVSHTAAVPQSPLSDSNGGDLPTPLSGMIAGSMTIATDLIIAHWG